MSHTNIRFITEETSVEYMRSLSTTQFFFYKYETMLNKFILKIIDVFSNEFSLSHIQVFNHVYNIVTWVIVAQGRTK